MDRFRLWRQVIQYIRATIFLRSRSLRLDMHKVIQRVFMLLMLSLSLAISQSILRSKEAIQSDQPVESESFISDLDDLSWLIIPTEEPLDLSELLKSLGEIPYLNSVPPLTGKSVLIPHVLAPKAVALAASDEPIVIGSGEKGSATEANEKTLPAQPSNPLRNVQALPPAADRKADSLSNSAPPAIDTSNQPSELIIDEKTKVEKLPGSPDALESKSGTETTRPSNSIPPNSKPSNSKMDAGLKEKADPIQLGDESISRNSTSNIQSPSSAVRSRPKMVEVKSIAADEQESPRLVDVPREIDAKHAREEDESAMIAKRPEAASKTFVGKPSTGRISGQNLQTVSDPLATKRAQRVESCLAFYMANLETVAERSPWAVMHAMLPFGVEGEILVGNRRVNSIQWMCYNGTCRTQKLFTPAGNYFRPNVGGGVQGHDGQFLAMLAQSQVSADYPIIVGQKKFTVNDLIKYEMATCKEKSELTFKLMALSYYIDTNQVWLTDKHSRWNIEKLIQEELAQPIVGAACGGTHRLMGLTFAVRQRQAEGRPINGQFARADQFVKEFTKYAWQLQNPDGSFSTNWFESRGNDPNLERKVQTTGHILEWLAFTLPAEELTTLRFTKSIDFLLSQIYDQRQSKWPIGPRGHATRAIAIYHQRTTGITPGQRHSRMAEQIQIQQIAR